MYDEKVVISRSGSRSAKGIRVSSVPGLFHSLRISYRLVGTVDPLCARARAHPLGGESPQHARNPRVRAPYCWNAAGAQSALRRHPTRTKRALAGASEAEIGAREKAAQAAGRLGESVPGVSCFMMSNLGVGLAIGRVRGGLTCCFISPARSPRVGAPICRELRSSRASTRISRCGWLPCGLVRRLTGAEVLIRPEARHVDRRRLGSIGVCQIFLEAARPVAGFPPRPNSSSR